MPSTNAVVTEGLQAKRTYPPLPVTLALAAVLNAVIALSLWLLVPAMGNLASTMVHSQCVGLSIALTAIGIGRLLRVAGRPAWIGLPMMLLPAAPIGYAVGHQLAQALLGRPVNQWSSGPVASAAIWTTVLATGLAGYVLWTRQRLAREAQAREAAQRLASEAQLRLLRAQLEPHMLFNTLANLRELMALDAPAAQRMLDSLIVYLRATLAATRTEHSTLGQEFAQLGAYLELMAVRMGARLSWRAELPDELRDMPVPAMLLQPLVENAIRHGLEPQPGPGSILLEAAREADGSLCISIIDSGRGLREPTLDMSAGETPASGYGLTHVRERLRALYGPAASLTLQAHSPRGTRACVRIPA